jgi:hypothetical protein
MAETSDLDEPFSLHPMEGEEVLRRLMGEDGEVDDASDDDMENEDS